MDSGSNTGVKPGGAIKPVGHIESVCPRLISVDF